MAKVISDEILKLKIVINGDEAQKRVLDLERANNTLAESINKLSDKNRELAKNKKLNSAAIEKNKLEIKKLTAEMGDNLKKIDEEVKGMNILSLTSDQLNKRIKDLAFTMKHMNTNSSAYKEAGDEMQRLTNRMKEVRSGTTQSAFSLQNLSDKFNQYSGIATAAIATLAGVAFSIQSVIDANNKMADAQTAVSKTTGLNIEQVKQLTAAFSEFDTRTKRIDLLKIAEIGGRLGVPADEIKDFTREVDKAYVALGDSFSGGVEAVAEKLGKIKGLFKETRDESISEAINEIGSALNELGASGAASEENMADFTLRIGQLPEALKPSIAETIALGGAFEESGITAERASSGYSKFVRVAATQTAEFAKVMGITQKEVKDLINQDPLQFFLKFAKGAKGLEATKLSEIMEGLKLNDAEVISVIGAASENTDRFTKSIELSNQALTEATSLQKEFDKVNNNSAAIYEKVQKKFSSMFTSETVAKTLNWLIEVFAQLLGVNMEAEKRMSTFGSVLVFVGRIIIITVAAMTSLSVAFALYNTLIKDSIVKNFALEAISKGRALTTQTLTTFQNLYNLAIGGGTKLIGKMAGAIGLQTTATNLQTSAQDRLNKVTKANPFGAVFAIVTLLVTAYMTWKTHAESAANAQKNLNEVTKQATQNAASEINHLDQVYKKLSNKNIAEKERIELLKKMQEQYPQYFKNLTTEDFLLGKAKNAYRGLRDAILATAQAKAAQSEVDKIAAKYLEEELEIKQRMLEASAKARTAGGTQRVSVSSTGAVVTTSSSDQNKKDAKNRFKIETENLKQLYKERNKALEPYIKYIDNAEKRSAKLNQSPETPDPKSNYEPLGGKGKSTSATKSVKKTEVPQWIKDRDKILEGEKSYQQKLLDLISEGERNRIEMMEDGFEKEKALILLNQSNKEAELESRKVSAEDLAKIDNIISKEQNSKLKKRLEDIRATWKQENDEYTKLQIQEKEIAAIKLQALEEKYQLIAFQKIQKDFDKRQKLKEREMNQVVGGSLDKHKEFLQDQGYTPETLAGITSWEESRAAIEKIYKEKRLREQMDYLKSLIGTMTVLQAMDPINFSEEQQAKLEEAKNTLAALGVEMSQLANGGNKDGGNLGSKLSGFGGQKDILGLTPDQWDAMIRNTDGVSTAIERVGAAIQVAQNMMAMYSEFAAANEAKLLQQYEVSSQRKQNRLDKQLKAGLITQEQYKKSTLKNERDLDRKKAELEYKQAKRQRAMQVAQTVANTAQAIMGIWAQFPKADYGIMAGIMSGVVGALGAIQVATILSQPMPEAPGAEDGFYPTMRKQDGKIFNARKRTQKSGIYSEPTLLVGEQGAGFPELVVTQKTARRIDPDISNAYMREIARVEGFEEGYYKNVKKTAGPSSAGSDEMMIKLISTIDSFNETMQDIKKNGLETYIKDSLDNGAKIDKMVKGSQELYNNNKHG